MSPRLIILVSVIVVSKVKTFVVSSDHTALVEIIVVTDNSS